MFALQSIGLCLTAARRRLRTSGRNPSSKALEQGRGHSTRADTEAIILGICAGRELALDRRPSRGGACARARGTGRVGGRRVRALPGPILFGLLALLERHPGGELQPLRRERACSQGGCRPQPHFWFRKYAIEQALNARDWDVALIATPAHARGAHRRRAAALFRHDRRAGDASLARIGRGAATEEDDRTLADFAHQDGPSRLPHRRAGRGPARRVVRAVLGKPARVRITELQAASATSAYVDSRWRDE